MLTANGPALCAFAMHILKAADACFSGCITIGLRRSAVSVVGAFGFVSVLAAYKAKKAADDGEGFGHGRGWGLGFTAIVIVANGVG